MSRILVINPNSSAAVTEAIEAAVAPLRTGPRSIGTQQESDGVVMPLVEWVRRDDADAFVLACFSDPGLQAVREAADGRPVLGIAECALLRALMLGESFGVIALSANSVRRQQRYVRQMGLASRYAGSWPVDATAEDTAGDAIRDRLAAAGRHLVAACRADVLVLGCAGMAGHRRALEEITGRPVVEPTQQAVAAALTALLLAGV
jgi:Asp/Glu/hydantoin racemase